MDTISKFQALCRGYSYRKNHLPNSIRYLKKYIKNLGLILEKIDRDGRINSAIEESKIINKMIEIMPLLPMGHRRIVEAPPRHWWDCKIYDFRYGWLPINIKITKTRTSDNSGNMTMLVYALTNENIVLDKSYKNGSSSKIFLNKVREKEFNNNNKRDYYFFTINKEDTSDIICNSIKGLTNITGNNNNPPFQICWNKNRKFKYRNSKEVASYICKTISSKKKTWQEEFLEGIRGLKI